MTALDFLYHATPLHYLPSIVQDGALYAQSVLAGRGIAPRRTAKRRDRMLGLADYVHLSFQSRTPLLADKLRRGYPHAVLVFRAADALALPGTALLPYNTKAWHGKAAFQPVTDRADQERLLRRHQEDRRYPSLEVLVKYGLDLQGLDRIAVRTEAERAALAAVCRRAIVCDPDLFPPTDTGEVGTWPETREYLQACAAAGCILPPPDLPFD